MKKSISIILTLCLLLSAICVSVSANVTSHPKKSNNLTLEDIPNIMKNMIQLDADDVIELDAATEDDLYSFSTINHDNTTTMYAFQTPVKYEDENGDYQFINNALEKRSFFSRIFSKFSYENKANSFKTLFPNQIGDGYTIENNGVCVEIRHLNLKSSKAPYIPPENENVLQYEVVGHATDLQVQPTNTGISETFQLASYTENNHIFSFEIVAPGLIPDKTSGAGIDFVDETTGNPNFSIGSCYLQDSSENGGQISINNYYIVEQSQQKDTYHVTLVTDEAFLKSNAVAYPVKAHIQYQSTDTELDLTDTSVYEKSSVNIHDSQWNGVGNMVTPGSDLGEGITYVKLGFAFRRMKHINPNLLTEVGYHVFDGSGTANTVTVDLYDSNQQLDLKNTTYNEVMSSLGRVVTSNVFSDVQVRQTFDITPLAKEWITSSIFEGGKSSNYGFMLRARNKTDLYKHFGSEENTNGDYRSYVSIVFTQDHSIQDNTYFIKNASTGLYLNMDATGYVKQTSFLGSEKQEWKVTVCDNGMYSIKPASDSGKSMALKPNSDKIITSATTTDSSMYFSLVQCGDGLYRMFNGNHVFNAISATGDYVNNTEYKNLYSQHWIFEQRDDKAVDMINELNQFALEYTDYDYEQAYILTLHYLRQERYNGSDWDEVAGELDGYFLDSANGWTNEFNFLKEPEYCIYDKAGNAVDIPHLAATLNALLYDSTSIEAQIVGETVVDNLAGWAGDLQSLMKDVQDKYHPETYDEFYSAFYWNMGSSAYSFSLDDLNADLDAIYLADNKTARSNFGAQLYHYFSASNPSDRKAYFLSKKGWTTLDKMKNDVGYYTNDYYAGAGGIGIKWPLLKDYSFEDYESLAAKDAFCDYIWYAIQ